MNRRGNKPTDYLLWFILFIPLGPEQVYTIDKVTDVSRRAAEVGG